MLDALKETRGWIRQGWTQGTLWRDSAGNELPPDQCNTDEIASCCIQGALSLVYAHSTGLKLGDNLTEAIWDQIPPYQREFFRTLDEWNDYYRRTQAEVLQVLDHAIAEAEETSK